ncbi:MAG TPA: alkaline phosphatase family protein [Candidatus Tumulicola sp.]|jgi:phospholipase C
MRRGFFHFAAFAIAALAIGCSSNGASPIPPDRFGAFQADGSSRGKIKHVVIIVQENRSFDNLFDCFPGTDCVKTAAAPAPRPLPTTKSNPCPTVPTPSPGPTPTPIKLRFNQKLTTYDIDHTYCAAFVQDYDGGKLDGFWWNIAGFPNGLATANAYDVVGEKYIQPYWDLAQQYVLGDRTFPTQASGSFTAHQDLIRGDTDVLPHESVIDYPFNHENDAPLWGCDDRPDSVTSLITSKRVYLYNQGPFPCFSYRTIRDSLDAKGVTWKYYAPAFPNNGGQYWNAFDAIDAVRHDKTEWPNKPRFTCVKSCVSWPQTNVLCDVAGSTVSPCPAPNPPGDVELPAVSFVIPDALDSDHGLGPTQKDNGPDWVASVVNAIGKSPYWNSTAIFIMWDEWGGFYDHVPPPQLDYQGLGFRVPLIVVSPYAKKGYVDHTQYEYGSLLKFVEYTFNLPSLGTTDVRANAVGNAFNFKQAPRKFVTIKLLNKGHDSRYFLMRPPSGLPVDSE